MEKEREESEERAGLRAGLHLTEQKSSSQGRGLLPLIWAGLGRLITLNHLSLAMQPIG